MNNEYNNWRIEQESLTRTRVFVDGVELQGVKSIRYTHTTQEAPTIVLEIIPKSINTDEDSTNTSQRIGFLPQESEGEEQ